MAEPVSNGHFSVWFDGKPYVLNLPGNTITKEIIPAHLVCEKPIGMELFNFLKNIVLII